DHHLGVERAAAPGGVRRPARASRRRPRGPWGRRRSRPGPATPFAADPPRGTPAPAESGTNGIARLGHEPTIT
ncbi:hypothetical protein, partial [Streptomyces fragilis]